MNNFLAAMSPEFKKKNKISVAAFWHFMVEVHECVDDLMDIHLSGLIKNDKKCEETYAVCKAYFLTNKTYLLTQVHRHNIDSLYGEIHRLQEAIDSILFSASTS